MRNFWLFLFIFISGSVFAETQTELKTNVETQSVSAFGETSTETQNNTETQSNHRKSYWYVGVDLGYADNHYDGWWQDYINDYIVPNNVNSSGFSGRIKLGGVLNQYIGFEFGALFTPKIEFNDIGNKYSYTKIDESFDQTLIDLSLRGTYPIKNFELIGKVGVATAYQYNIKASNNGYDYISDDVCGQNTWLLGAGVGYHINRYLLAEVSYLHYFAMSEFPGTDFVAAGISFTF